MPISTCITCNFFFIKLWYKYRCYKSWPQERHKDEVNKLESIHHEEIRQLRDIKTWKIKFSLDKDVTSSFDNDNLYFWNLCLRDKFERPRLSDNRILYVVSQFHLFDTDAGDTWFTSVIAIFPTNNANISRL